MKGTVLQIFDKKSPLFLIKIAVLIISILLKFEESSATLACQSKSFISIFNILIIIVFGFEIIFKVILIEVVNCICTVTETTKIVGFFFCYLGEIATLAMGYIILFGRDFISNCKLYEPHYTFVQFFVLLYTVVEVGVLLYLADTICSKKEITVLGTAHQDNSLY